MDNVETASQQIKRSGVTAILRGDFSVEDVLRAYLKALRAPLNDMHFVPTGGISIENIGDYARAGAVAVGMGSRLVPDRKITSHKLTERAFALREAWKQARNG